MEQHWASAALAADRSFAEGSCPPAPRQCGRCRAAFPGDPSLTDGGKGDWWLCPPCHDRLLGAGARPAAWAPRAGR